MSTRSTIGFSGEFHLYTEWQHEDLRIADNKDQVISLMPRSVWDEMRAQIISAWLQGVSNGHAELKEVWGTDSIAKLDKKKLIENFIKVLEHVDN